MMGLDDLEQVIVARTESMPKRAVQEAWPSERKWTEVLLIELAKLGKERGFYVCGKGCGQYGQGEWQVDEVNDRLVSRPQSQGAAGPPLEYRPPVLSQRIGRLLFAMEGYTAAPTSQQTEEVGVASKLLNETTEKLKKLDADIAALNKMMNEAGIPHIGMPEAGAPAPPTRRRR